MTTSDESGWDELLNSTDHDATPDSPAELDEAGKDQLIEVLQGYISLMSQGTTANLRAAEKLKAQVAALEAENAQLRAALAARDTAARRPAAPAASGFGKRSFVRDTRDRDRDKELARKKKEADDAWADAMRATNDGNDFIRRLRHQYAISGITGDPFIIVKTSRK